MTDCLNEAINRIRSKEGGAQGKAPSVIYIRETVQVLTPDGETVPIQEEVYVEAMPVRDEILEAKQVEKMAPDREEKRSPTKHCVSEDTSKEEGSAVSPTSPKVDKAVSVDLEEDKLSVASGHSRKSQGAQAVDLSGISRNGIEALLVSLTRRVRDIEISERESGGRVAELTDVDDSARAESITSGVSSTSSKGTRERRREDEAVGEYDPETQSTMRRQSVIIEGLTLETEELRKKCHQLEEEVGCGTPLVEDLTHKLQLMENRLEESETYCYQVIEENVEMKSEMEALESEIAEVQDTFRDKDAKEFKKTKWELENLSKTCRNLQLKLSKAQSKANRLRQEKEEAEELAREQMIWKTTALIAAAALATYSVLSRVK